MPKNNPMEVYSYLSHEVVERKILSVRGNKAMLDKDLAELYQVPTKTLVQAVKRNINRFPSDFMYQLTDKEVVNLRSQFVTSSWGGRRYRPYLFTEQGIAMLSSVLKSDRAIQVNIYIMRTFMKMREIALGNKDLRIKIEELEKKYDKQFQVVFKAIKLLFDDRPKPGETKRF